MQGDLPRRGFAWLGTLAITLFTACGGDGDGTGPPGGDEDTAQQAAAAGRAADASAEFEQFVVAGNPDPVGALVASLESDPDVVDVERFDGHGAVIATLESGLSFSVWVAEQNRDEWVPLGSGQQRAPPDPREDFSAAAVAASSATPPISCSQTNFPQSKKACVLRTIDFELFGGEEGIDQALRRAGYDITGGFVPSSAQQIVELQQTLATCGVLYISAHGGLARNLEGGDQPGKLGNHILTDIEIGKAGEIDEAKFIQLLQVLGPAFGQNFKRFFGEASHDGTTYLTLSPEFFGSVSYPNSFVFVNACASDAPAPGGTQLRDVFQQQGAGAFLGWKRDIPAALANPAATEIFDALAPKFANLDTVIVSASPPDPDPGQSYVVTATISPAQAGVEVSLSVRGTDGFIRDETGTTSAGGAVIFAQIPGGQGQVTDSITVAAGGASNSATAVNAVYGSPTLQASWGVPWFAGGTRVNDLTLTARTADYNLACANSKLSQTLVVVKF